MSAKTCSSGTRVLSFAGAILIASLSSAAFCAPITITSTRFVTRALDGFGPYSDTDFTSTSTNVSVTDTSVDGVVHATTTYKWQELANEQKLDFSFDHDVGANSQLGDYAQLAGSLIFTANEDLSYSVFGDYSLDGLGQISFSLDLYDRTDNSYLFRNTQVSTSTVDEKFSLGKEEGDSQNRLLGSMPFGFLVAGHEYYLGTNTYIQNKSRTTAPFSASGQFNVLLAATVPEPETYVLMLTGLAIMGWTVSRKKRTQAAV